MLQGGRRPGHRGLGKGRSGRDAFPIAVRSGDELVKMGVQGDERQCGDHLIDGGTPGDR
jgi:hypothetical protein